MTNFYLHDKQTVNGLKKIAWAFLFYLMSPYSCLHVHVSMSPCLHVYVSLSMSPVSMSPCLHFSMFPSLMSMSPYFHVSISMSPSFHVSGIPQTENETNGKWQLPFVCCKWKSNGKLQFFYCKQKRKTEVCFP
jgi:hypothetical protein